MTEPRNYDTARRRVVRRFERTIEDEELTVSGIMQADVLLRQHGDQVVALAQEGYGFESSEEARQWVSVAVGMGTRAVAVTRGDRLVAFTWGESLGDAETNHNDMARAANVVATRSEELDVDQSDVIYSNALVVERELRGRGIGSGLALRALELCREELYPDGALLFYRIRPENTAGLHASRTLGAEQTDVVSPNGKVLWNGYIPPLEDTNS